MKFTVTKKQEVTQDIELCEFMKRDTNFYKFDFENATVSKIKTYQSPDFGIFPSISKDTIIFYSRLESFTELEPSTFEEWRNALEDVLDKLNIV
jgi:hypothetical protein